LTVNYVTLAKKTRISHCE